MIAREAGLSNVLLPSSVFSLTTKVSKSSVHQHDKEIGLGKTHKEDLFDLKYPDMLIAPIRIFLHRLSHGRLTF